jgi:hypothetical protein
MSRQVSVKFNDLESARALFKTAESLGLHPVCRVYGHDATTTDGDSIFSGSLSVVGFRGARVLIAVDRTTVWCTIEPNGDREGIWVAMDEVQ